MLLLLLYRASEKQYLSSLFSVNVSREMAKNRIHTFLHKNTIKSEALIKISMLSLIQQESRTVREDVKNCIESSQERASESRQI